MRDAHNIEFVFKYHPRTPKRAIHDALGAHVGKSIGIAINAVEIYGANHALKDFFDATYPLKDVKGGVTTLHSRVPGLPIKKIKKMNQVIDIKRGLYTTHNLESLVHYKDLSVLVALDIFTDNPDRHNKNFLFDKKTNIFYAIDMDHSFNNAYALLYTPAEYNFCTMATRAYNFLITRKKTHLSREKINALKIIQKILIQLVQHNSPERLYIEWIALADKANFKYSVREQEKIKKYLTYNAAEVTKLLDLLDTIIDQ